MSAMGETLYSLNSGRTYEHAQDLTPYSAVCFLESFSQLSYTTQILSDSDEQVSSFNLPQRCDSTLITPVSLTQPLAVVTTIAPSDMDIKLSPSDSMSPKYDMFNIEDDYVDAKYNPPMKYKSPSGMLHISTTDSAFPPSPLVPSTPYWGAYGVSATPISSASDSSPSMNPSPIGPSTLNSASGYSDSGQSRQGVNYRSRAAVPLLIAPRVPSPSSRQPPTAQLHSPFRQNSLQSNASSSSAQTHATFTQPRTAMPIRRRRKSPKHSRDVGSLLSGDMSRDEQILMRLTEVDRLPWKEVAVKFREETGKAMKVPALQMRKKRLVERLRDRALTLAFRDLGKVRWDQIAQAMLKYGCVEKWSKEMVEKKWYEKNPERDGYHEAFVPSPGDRLHVNDDYGMDDHWSDGIHSVSHSLHGSESGPLSAISTTTMDEVRSRHTSDASVHHLQLQRQQIMFEQQQQRQQQNTWNSGNS